MVFKAIQLREDHIYVYSTLPMAFEMQHVMQFASFKKYVIEELFLSNWNLLKDINFTSYYDNSILFFFFFPLPTAV